MVHNKLTVGTLYVIKSQTSMSPLIVSFYKQKYLEYKSTPLCSFVYFICNIIQSIINFVPFSSP